MLNSGEKTTIRNLVKLEDKLKVYFVLVIVKANVERISKKKKDMQIYVNTSRYLCISIFRDLDTIVRAGIAREGLMFRSRWTLA